MKAVILGASTAIVAIIGVAAPASATGNFGGYVAGNTGMSSNGYVHMGIKDGKIIFEGESFTCIKSNAQIGFNGSFGNAQPVQQSQPVLGSADTSNCNPNQVVNNPPANSTVTINGLCNEEAAKAKANITGNNVNVIVNSTGPCEKATPTTPVQVIVTPNAPEPKEVKTASVTTTTESPAAVDALPQTGGEGAIVAGIASVLAGATYAGAMVVRNLRGRA